MAPSVVRTRPWKFIGGRGRSVVTTVVYVERGRPGARFLENDRCLNLSPCRRNARWTVPWAVEGKLRDDGTSAEV